VACPAPGAGLDVRRFQEVAGDLGLGPVPVHVWPWESLPLTGSYKVRRLQLRKRLTSVLRPGAADSAPAPAAAR
jgi:acyl-CoA synthetase (AMP-forming)/AMP-acid ligase II